MRLRRLSFIAGWAALLLLAIVGLAAFGTPSGSTPAPDAASTGATMGHTTGAYAGLTFAFYASDGAVEAGTAATTAEEADPLSESDAPTTTISLEVDSSGWLTQIQMRSIVAAYFNPTDVNRAIRVAWCESRFNPESVDGRTGAVGLFQHLPKYWAMRAEAAGFAGADPTDPEANVAAAAWEVYKGGGWDVFDCRG
jgi:hypothetical protein